LTEYVTEKEGILVKPVAFSYHRPQTLTEAIEILRAEPDAKVVAGGQSLIPLMNFRLSRPKALVDINDLTDLATIERIGDLLYVGGLVRHQQLHEHPEVRALFPALAEAAGEIGHWAIRNRGTMGGSLAHADPAAELPAAMVAFGATLILTGADGERRVPADEFFYGYLMTDIQPHEVLTGVELPLPVGRRFGFAEFARRPGDFALAGAFLEYNPETASGAVTWFGLGGRPERRELEFPENAKERQTLFSGFLEGIDGPEADAEATYRRRLAVLAAERAYGKALNSERGM
jgi:CO/xanthine dehydrogenase FAD-binding subunit